VIVKDIRRPGAKFVGVVAAMRKLAGVQANNGWQMIDGAARPPRRASPYSRRGSFASPATCR
jgi:hypothetical protein